MTDHAPLTEQIMVRMSAEMLAALQDNAATEERSVAQTVRLAIRSYLRVAAVNDER